MTVLFLISHFCQSVREFCAVLNLLHLKFHRLKQFPNSLYYCPCHCANNRKLWELTFSELQRRLCFNSHSVSSTTAFAMIDLGILYCSSTTLSKFKSYITARTLRVYMSMATLGFHKVLFMNQFFSSSILNKQKRNTHHHHHPQTKNPPNHQSSTSVT